MIGNIEYSDCVKIEALVDMSDIDAFTNWIIDITNNSVTLIIGEVSYREIPV